jgi:Zn finger protein HypA/HybF involved in hydrogenase expression
MNKFTKEDYENAAKVSLSYAGMCRYLGIAAKGGNYATIKKKIKEYNIDISHFTGQGWNVGMKFKPFKKYTLEEILQKNFDYQPLKLKKRLIEEGIKEHKCECCQRTEWNDKPIPLELHHINGDRTDNRLENLQILCPNCHAQTEHYRGKNQVRYEKKEFISDIELKELAKKEKEQRRNEKAQKIKEVKARVRKPKEIRYCKNCGKELTNKQKIYCSQECEHEAVSKRPPVLELIDKIKEFNNNMSAIGRYYGVSDNAIRKWCRLYKLI